MLDLTTKEIEEAIKQKTTEREQSIAQANFAAGQIAAWTELLQRLKHSEAETAMTSAQTKTEAADAPKQIAARRGNGVLSPVK